MSRDFDKNPYSLEEGRVCDYLQKIAPDIGCGDDPIGFLIASHATFHGAISEYEANIEKLELELLGYINDERHTKEERMGLRMAYSLIGRLLKV